MFRNIRVLRRNFSTINKKDVTKIVPKKHKYDIENESWFPKEEKKDNKKPKNKKKKDN